MAGGEHGRPARGLENHRPPQAGGPHRLGPLKSPYQETHPSCSGVPGSPAVRAHRKGAE